MARRRQLLTGAAALTGSSLLGACGFAPRRPPLLAFRRLGILGRSANPQWVALLANELAPSAEIVTPPWRAQLCLWIQDDSARHSASYSDSNALVQGVQLTLSLRYALTLPPTREVWERWNRDLIDGRLPLATEPEPPHGRLLWPAVTLETRRDASYSESRALASQLALQDLQGALRADLARHVALRLAALDRVPDA